MLVLKRKEGQWVEITHRSGDLIRVRVCNIAPGNPGHLDLAFDDEARHFAIERPERHRRADAPAAPPGPRSWRGLIDEAPGSPALLRGTRVPAADVVDRLRCGDTWAEVLLAHPALTEDHVRAAIHWGLDAGAD